MKIKWQLYWFKSCSKEFLTPSTGLYNKQFGFPLECVDLTEIPHDVLSDPGSLLVPVQQMSLVVAMADDSQQETVTVHVSLVLQHPSLQSSHFLQCTNAKREK